jgi:uncharacterized protein
MRQTFADTSYWVATLDDKDQWFEQAMDAASEIGDSEIITTKTVLIEVLNHISDYRADIKDYVANYVEVILKDEETLVLLHNHEIFQKALKLYKSRFDKGYSLTDCISMNAMRDFNINEILTNDTHFQQEGFIELF